MHSLDDDAGDVSFVSRPCLQTSTTIFLSDSNTAAGAVIVQLQYIQYEKAIID